MALESDDVVKEITGYIRKLNHVIHTGLSKSGQPYGLTGSQCRLLRVLSDFGDLSSAQLSRKLYVTPANITGIIDRLEKKELVKRLMKQKDRRISHISLSEKGQALARHMPDPIEEKLTSGFKHLSQGDVHQIKESIKQIIQMLDTETVNSWEGSSGASLPG
ncbi:MAG: MarR family transcriptional regulator [Desulfobacteraceae bacterium]